MFISWDAPKLKHINVSYFAQNHSSKTISKHLLTDGRYDCWVSNSYNMAQSWDIEFLHNINIETSHQMTKQKLVCENVKTKLCEA